MVGIQQPTLRSSNAQNLVKLDGQLVDKSEARVSFKAVVVKLMHMMRLMRTGRRRRKSVDYIKRNKSFGEWEAVTDPEAEFVGRVMTAIPLMRRTSKLVQAVCNNAPPSAESEVPDIAAEAIYQARMWTARIAYRESAEASARVRTEAEQWKGKYEALQSQFQTARHEFLTEVAALRDQVRVRGDPEGSVKNAQNFDVTFFFDPMHVLQPAELDFCLKVIAEKVKMIFEANPTVSNAPDFGQASKLKALEENKELGRLQQVLKRKNAEFMDLEREYNRLQKQCRVLETGMEHVLSESKQQQVEAAQSIPKEAEEQICHLQDQVATLSESQQETKKALAEQYKLVETRTLERDEVNQAWRDCEEEWTTLKRSLKDTRKATALLEGDLQRSLAKEDHLSKQIEELRDNYDNLLETNSKLRQLVKQLKHEAKTGAAITAAEPHQQTLEKSDVADLAGTSASGSCSEPEHEDAVAEKQQNTTQADTQHEGPQSSQEDVAGVLVEPPELMEAYNSSLSSSSSIDSASTSTSERPILHSVGTCTSPNNMMDSCTSPVHFTSADQVQKCADTLGAWLKKQHQPEMASDADAACQLLVEQIAAGSRARSEEPTQSTNNLFGRRFSDPGEVPEIVHRVYGMASPLQLHAASHRRHRSRVSQSVQPRLALKHVCHPPSSSPPPKVFRRAQAPGLPTRSLDPGVDLFVFGVKPPNDPRPAKLPERHHA